MRTIKNLSKLNGRVYVYLANAEIGQRFMQQAEAEGFTFKDGAKPTERGYEEVMAINHDGSLNFVGTNGRIAYGSGVCLRGNHDHYALIFLKRFAAQDRGAEDDHQKDAFKLWLEDGGAETFSAFSKLDDNEKRSVLSFLDLLPYYEMKLINGQRFLLAHTVCEKAKLLDIEKCDLRAFVFGEPEYEKCYFEDMTIITGHTPTGFIDPAYTGRIWKGKRHIAIDCGAVFGNPLGCICLDTMEEIYID